MKTLEQVVSQYKMDTIDGRDILRLSKFVPDDMLPRLGVELKPEYVGKHVPLKLTRKNVLRQLELDVAFGFEKALNQRGLSSAAMHSVVRMWNWILEEGLEGFDDYAQYGLPLFKATAVKYGFDNPIGDDSGDESRYAEHENY